MAPPAHPAKGRKYKRCTRYVQAGNTLHFSGRLNGRKLRPGTYRLQAIASIDGQESKPVTVSFKIVRWRRGQRAPLARSAPRRAIPSGQQQAHDQAHFLVARRGEGTWVQTVERRAGSRSDQWPVRLDAPQKQTIGGGGGACRVLGAHVDSSPDLCPPGPTAMKTVSAAMVRGMVLESFQERDSVGCPIVPIG